MTRTYTLDGKNEKTLLQSSSCCALEGKVLGTLAMGELENQPVGNDSSEVIIVGNNYDFENLLR